MCDPADRQTGQESRSLGFELRGDVGKGALRWLTVGPPGQPGTSIVLTPPGVDPSISDEERRVIIDMMAKGTYGAINLATPSVGATFAELEAAPRARPRVR